MSRSPTLLSRSSTTWIIKRPISLTSRFPLFGHCSTPVKNGCLGTPLSQRWVAYWPACQLPIPSKPDQAAWVNDFSIVSSSLQIPLMSVVR